jgi:L-malate glycosyltransferase
VSRVLLLIRKLWNGGGTETYVYTLAKELQRSGHTVGVFTAGGPWVSYFRKNGIQVHVCPNYHLAAYLGQTIRLYNYSVMHAQDLPSLHLVRRLRNKRNLRIVYTVHGRYVRRKALGRLASTAHAIIAVSPSLQNYVISCGIPAYKVHLISNGISRLFHPATLTTEAYKAAFRSRYHIPEGAFVIGYAGRFTFDKTTLSRRISSILCTYANTHPNTWILIAGRNAKAVIAPSQKCIVLGQVTHMENFYHICDVVVGTARVALESLTCGKPTIAVGFAKYIGTINDINLYSAHQSNFGDHGAVRSHWAASKLLGALEFIRGNLGFHRMKALILSQIVQDRYSASRMVQQILQLYL